MLIYGQKARDKMLKHYLIIITYLYDFIEYISTYYFSENSFFLPLCLAP